MNKNEILLKLIDMAARIKAVHRTDAQFGWDAIEVEKEIAKLEDSLAEQVDTLMANQYRLFNVAKEKRRENEDVTRVPRRHSPRNGAFDPGEGLSTRR